MTRAGDWSPLVPSGDDPVPGRPEEVAALGGQFRRVAAVIHESAARLRALAQPDETKSEAVDAFRAQALITADHVGRAEMRYEGAGRALETWASALRAAQDESLAARADAERAQSEMTAHEQQAGIALDGIDAAPEGADTTALQVQQQAARAAADRAGGALAAARARLGSAVAALDGAARRAADDIDATGEHSGLVDSVGDDAAEATAEVVKWADRIALAAGSLALVVGWIPVVGQAAAAVLGTIAAAAGIVSLLGNVYLMIKGDAEWHDVLLAGIGAVSFGLGKLAVAGLKTSVKGVQGATRLSAGKLEAASSGAAARSLKDFRLATGLSKNQARTLVQASREQPRLASRARLRTLPGELRRDVVENVQTLRDADWGQAWTELRAPGRFGGDWSSSDAFTRVMGERSTAEEIARLKTMPEAVRGHADTAEQLALLEQREKSFRATGRYALFDLAGVQATWGQVGMKDLVLPPPEASLGLPDTPAPLLPPVASAPAAPR